MAGLLGVWRRRHEGRISPMSGIHKPVFAGLDALTITRQSNIRPGENDSWKSISNALSAANDIERGPIPKALAKTAAGR